MSGDMFKIQSYHYYKLKKSYVEKKSFYEESLL